MKALIRPLLMTAVVIFLILVVASAVDYSSEFFHERTLDQHRTMIFSDVYAHHGDYVKDVPFHPGDPLVVHYRINRLKTCTVNIQFRLTKLRGTDRFTGGESIGFPMVAYYGPPAKLTTDEYFKIPSSFPSGAYELRRLNFVDCDNVKWVEFAPPAPLTIIRP